METFSTQTGRQVVEEVLVGGYEYTPKVETIEKFQLIPINAMPGPEEKRLAHRLNSFGSLFYFTAVTLRKHRLSPNLHRMMCSLVESTSLKEVIEIPRDHYKSTIYSEATPIWWALPFEEKDQDIFRSLGYSESFIAYMKRVHNRNTRTLLVSETIKNAEKLGNRIRNHYTQNDLFQAVFPEILPDASCKWTDSSLHHKRTNEVNHGEGTYDFIGVGAALQSRHYDRVIQDDLVGKKALDEPSTMEETIEYHKLLVGAFDSDVEDPEHDNDEIVVGNRWSHTDLNFHIRENEKYFRITNHSAEGGCCKLHPPKTLLFPEGFGWEKLARWQSRLGTYLYSCQFLNSPTAPEDRGFKESDLRYYDIRPVSATDNRAIFYHEVKEGEVIDDLMPGNMARFMIVDPNHAGQSGRCRHAITVCGILKSPFRIYLLDAWAEACDYTKFVNKIYELCKYWKLGEFWLETIAAQKYLKLYLDYRNKIENRFLRVNELKVDMSANAKERRIQSLQTFFIHGQFWMLKGHKQGDFKLEYCSYPLGKTKDILDTLGYGPQVWHTQMSSVELKAFFNRDKIMMPPSNSITGY